MRNDPVEMKDSVQEYLNNTLLAVVSWTDGTVPESGSFIFGNDTRGRIYLRIRSGSRLETSLRKNPHIALLISREEPELEKIVSIQALGKGEILEDPTSQESLEGYRWLRKKSPLLGQTPHTDGVQTYRIIRIVIQEFQKFGYSDFADGRSPVVLKRKGFPAP